MALNHFKAKHTMAKHNEQVQVDGPLFIYYFLRNYAAMASQPVCSTQAKLDKLDGERSKAFHWNVDKFTTYVSALLVTLAENGGNDGLVFDNVYKLLAHSPCLLFNSEIVVFKQVHSALLNVHRLLIK